MKRFNFIIIIILSLVFVFLMSEIFLRVKWSNYWKNSGRVIVLKELVPKGYRVYSRKGLFKKGGYVTIEADEDGFLMPNRIEKKEKREITVTFLGASTTQCFWVNGLLRFPYLVAKNISDDLNISVKVLNAASSGSTSQHSLNVLLNKVVKYEPEIILMMHAVNDADVLMELGDYKNVIKNHDTSFLEYFSAKIYLLGFLRHLRAQNMVEKQHRTIAENSMQKMGETNYMMLDSEALEKGLSKFSARLKIFVHMTRDIGAIPILMTQPYYEKIDYELTEKEKRTFLGGVNYLDHFNKRIREICESEKCYLVDLANELGRDAVYFYDNIHYTEEGSQEVSKIISRHLKKIIKEVIFI